MGSMDVVQTERAREIAKRVEEFVRTVVVPYERDPRCGSHGPSEELVRELRSKARRLPDGIHFRGRCRIVGARAI